MGGAVAACSYDFELKAEIFKLITNKEDRDASRGSKYMQSIPGDIFSDCAKWMRLNPGKPLLFVGVGCQAAGFQSYIKARGLEKNAYIVDLICHGSPSPKIWREYADKLETAWNGKMQEINFRDKRNGWKHSTPYIIINNKEILVRDYMNIFYSRCALRPSCHVCPYTTVYRNTDMTMGDFWGIDTLMPDFYSDKGNSLILVHSEKGQKLFHSVSENLEYRESNLKDCLQLNRVQPTKVSPERKKFWREYRKKGIDYIVKKYGQTRLWKKVLGKMHKAVRLRIKGR